MTSVRLDFKKKNHLHYKLQTRIKYIKNLFCGSDFVDSMLTFKTKLHFKFIFKKNDNYSFWKFLRFQPNSTNFIIIFLSP